MKITFFDKYYHTLGLSPEVDDAAIKSAYRRLAKAYHPDRSGTENTRQDFIRINEAYMMLMKRHIFIEDAMRRMRERELTRRKGTTPEHIRRQARNYADMKFEAFAKTPIFKTAVVINSAFDYLILGIGIFMVIAPVFTYFADMSQATEKGEEPEFFVLPVVFGVCFLYGVWYFIFRQKEEL